MLCLLNCSLFSTRNCSLDIDFHRLVLSPFNANPTHPNPFSLQQFVQSGGLQKIQQLRAEEGSKLAEYVAAINACFPPEIVQYYSPNYAQTLLRKLDDYEEKA